MIVSMKSSSPSAVGALMYVFCGVIVLQINPATFQLATASAIAPFQRRETVERTPWRCKSDH